MVFDVQKVKVDFLDRKTFCICCNSPVPQAGSDYPLCCMPQELASIGTGYSLYFAFKKCIIWVLLTITLIVSLICLIIAGVQINKSEIQAYFANNQQSYITKISAGIVVYYMQIDHSEQLGDVMVGLNIAGIAILLISSIFIRRHLEKMNIHLDKDKVSPSDYGLVVRNIPRNMKKEDLQKEIEKRYEAFAPKVVYINYCYDIKEMVELNEKLAELSKLKAELRLNIKKQIISQGITKAEFKAKPVVLEPPTTGMLCWKKPITIKELSEEIKLT